MTRKRVPPGPSAPTPPALAQKFAQLWEAREELLSPHDILIQAKALMLCALPYKRIPEKSFVKRAQVGREASISVTFSALGDVDLPFGADRALFAWIQTKAYADGFVTFETMREFLDTFGLGDDGHNYRLFNQRLHRLKNLSVSIRLETRDEEMQLNTVPIKAAYTPNSSTEVRRRISDEAAGQLMIVPDRYGFRLDPDFWSYLRANPVPMPLALMKLFHDEPKAWDFCQVILYRCYAARSTSAVPWDGLLEQLGSRDTNPKQLKYTLKKVLDRMKVVYSNLPAEFLPAYQGLSVGPWRPPKD